MAETPRSEEIGLHNLKPKPGSKRPRKRIGRGEGSGLGKTSGRGHKGAGSRAGAKQKAGYEGGQNPIHMRMRKLRGPHMKKSMPFENFRTKTQPVNLSDLEERFDAGAEVTPATLKEKGLAKRSDPVKILARGEISKKLDGPRARLQRRRQREDRGGRRFLSHSGAVMLRTILNAFSVADIRKKLAFTAAMLALYRLGAYIPAPGVDVDAVKEISEQLRRLRDPRLPQPLLGRQPLAPLSLFALGIMPYITASIILQLLTVVVPSLERLQKEGEVGQQKITQYTRYLTVGLAFVQSLGYVFLFRSFGNEAGTSVVGTLTFPKVFLIVICLTAGCTLLMWLGELITQRGIGNGISLMIFASIVSSTPQRDHQVVGQPGPGLRRDDAVHRARRDRRDRLRPGGPAPHPGPVRETRGRAQNDLGRLDLPAAAGQHGRRHPGHLRRLDHGLPADDRPAAQHPGRARLRRLLQPEHLGLRGRRGLLHHRLHLLLHRGHLQPGRPGRQPEEIRRLHPRRASRAGRPPSTSTGSSPA